MRRHDAVNELLKPLADGKTIVWTDWSGFFTLDDGRLRPGLNDDGLHPNAKGYAEWAKVALPVWKAACEFGRAGVPPPAADGDGTPSLPRLKSVSSHVVTIEANRFARADAPKGFRWEFIPGLGYGEGAMEVFPRIAAPTGAKLSYNVAVPSGASGSATLELSPLDQGIAFEQVLVDWQR